MELKEFTNQILKLLNINTVNDIPEKLMQTIKKPKELKKFIKSYNQLLKKGTQDMDYLQGLYEFWLSNREELSQDYTPQSLAKLVAMLSNHENENTIYDMCCGMGSLTLAKHKSHEQCNYILKELDQNVLPFLLFKLCYKQINAKVYCEDVLTNEKKKTYIIRNGILINELTLELDPTIDTVISNPPFNLRLDKPITCNNETFEQQLNFAFIYKALEELSDDGVGVFILPSGVLSSSEEKKYRKYLVDNDLLDIVISVPGKMFANTSIPTTVIRVRKNKRDKRKGKVTFIKSAPTGLFERKQKGEDHMKTRVYTKTFLYYTDTDLLEIAEYIMDQKTEPEHCITVDIDTVKDKDYEISPSRYIPMKDIVDTSRSFKDIVNDIKRCDTRRGLVKLTLNQTLAKSFDLELFEEHNKSSDAIFNSLRGLLKDNPDKMDDLTMEDLDYTPLHYFQLSKKKNEIKFEQNTKDTGISEMFSIMMTLWIQNVKYVE